MTEERKDGRSATSPVNGAKGGAPTKNYVQLAREFLQDSQLTVLEYGGNYYVYIPDAGGYRVWDPIRLQTAVKAWFVEKYSEKFSRNAVSEIAGVLGVVQRGAVPQPPVFLDSGKSAWNFIAFRNGILNVSQAVLPIRLDGRETLRPRVFRNLKTPDFFSADIRPFNFDPKATCPTWERYLEILDAESREMVQLWFGYNVSGDRSLPIFMLFVGERGTGKSVAVSVLRALMENRLEPAFGPKGEEDGEDRTDWTGEVAPTVANLSIGDFGAQFRAGILTRASANICDEALPSKLAAGFEEALKNASGGNDARGIEEVKHGTIRGNLKLRVACTFVANGIPVWADKSGALWARMRVVPFSVMVRGTSKDNADLAKTIIANEMPGVLNWALEGARKLARLRMARKPFPQSAAGQAKVDGVRRKQDPMEFFISSGYGYKYGAVLTMDEFYEDYCRYADEHGVDVPEEFADEHEPTRLAKKMRQRLSLVAREVIGGVDTGRIHGGRRVLKNIAPLAECSIEALPVADAPVPEESAPATEPDETPEPAASPQDDDVLRLVPVGQSFTADELTSFLADRIGGDEWTAQDAARRIIRAAVKDGRIENIENRFRRKAPGPESSPAG